MSKRSWKDYLRQAWKAKDESALDQIMKDAEEHEEPDGDENETHIHLHVGEKSDDAKGRARDKDDDDKDDDDKKSEDGLTDRVAKLEDGMKSLDAKLGKVLDAVTKAKDKDDDKDDDKEETDDEGNPFAKKKDDDDKEDTDDEMGGEGAATAKKLGSAGPELMEADPALKTGKSRMGDAKWNAAIDGALTKLIQDTIARAEVLSPGIKLPTFDGVTVPDAGNMICNLRRSALVKAAATDAGKRAIGASTAGSLKSLDCKALRGVFIDASDRMRGGNNAAIASGGGWMGSTSDVRSVHLEQSDKLKKINAANQAFWDKQLGRPNITTH